MNLFSSLKAPAGDSAFAAGRGVLVGASLFGIGALCYYGSGLSANAGIIDRSLLWPAYVRERLKSTFSYFSAAIVFTGASATFMLRFPAFHNFIVHRPIFFMIGSMMSVLAINGIVHSIPYNGIGLDSKHLAWAAQSAFVGAMLSPMVFFIGPQLAIRAAFMTAGVALSLSALAFYAPSERFLQYGGVLGMGFGMLIASDLARFFFPMASVAGTWLTSVSLYGGVVLFSLMLLYETQRVVKVAENPHPVYDPVNMSTSMYMSVINLFVRILSIMSGGSTRRK